MNCRGKLRGLGKVQMNVTFPHRQKGSALSSLRFAEGQALSEAKDLSAERDRPFASLRVTRWDGCNGEGLFFPTEPCLKLTTPHPRFQNIMRPLFFILILPLKVGNG